ncbi:MAG: TonB-dependent receptor plug domain-containing protein, partial [Candidatus Marinimicrobia bacterium]|nr:TonB-dependent receptor plug domain-containing protein [Candidatus Neomarinimicrobiota bacterium]
ANTPVAYTNVSKEEMEIRLGSQDIPLVLNTTSSVYATNQGGGAGDARINVRGFNQRNVAVMINGVPQNDMENGWVYWSNWDGVGDATSSIQMQRGLSAVNLATPSIGGTMNIITDPTKLESGGSVKQEAGSGSFLKTTVNYNTGLIGDKMALSSTIVRKTGEGVVNGTWTDAWAYYFGASYALNSDNRFELYAIGAPQRHGQRRYKQNIAAFDSTYAKTVDGFDEGAIDAFVESVDGRNYNENVSPVSSSYKGKQYWYMYGEGGLFGGGLVDRYDPDFLNESENYFHKPLVNLNHYLNLTDKLRLSTVAYWSGGSGGGTGTYGSVKWNYHAGIPSPSRFVNYDLTIANNSTVDSAYSNTENRSYGILRNSINRQSTIGLISKLNFDMSDMLKLQVGVDWRSAGIEHTREVRDLLGGDYYVDDSDPNMGGDYKVGLGDNIDYHSETTVDWIGFFGQASYTAGPVAAYGMAGFSSIKYSYQDHFTIADEVVKSDAIAAMQFKGGGKYHLAENLSVFGNFGIVEKPPIMDNVIYFDGTVASDPANEQFTSAELGMTYKAKMFALTANAYNTDWKDRNLTKAVDVGAGSSGDTDVIFLTGVNQNHKGVEIEATVQPMKMLRFDAALSFGNWQFLDDADGDYRNESGEILGEYTYALKDLKVGDMPQTSYVFGATVTPIPGLRVQALFSMYSNNYADWSPDSREYDLAAGDTPDREQVWTAPDYSKLDIHASYDLPKVAGINSQLFLHVFNALDEIYVQDALDNSAYNSYKVDGEFANSHGPDAAEVYLGVERFMNFGLKLNF